MPDPSLAQPVAVPPPPNLLTAPQSLPPPQSGTVADLLQNHLQVAQAYHQLASKYCRLLSYLQQAPAACAAWMTTTQNNPPLGADDEH